MAPSVNLVTKLKVQLKLSIARLRMVQHRDEALAKAARRTMAQLLDSGKEESARIRVENIIRSDITSELHEILELYCELLIARAGLLDSPVCDPGLEEAVKSIIYAAPKTEIKELHVVRQLLGERFGKEFVLAAMENRDGKVSPKVVRKLSVVPPSEELVRGYLEEIARAYGVQWPRRPAGGDLGEVPTLLDEDAVGDDDDVTKRADGGDGAADDDNNNGDESSRLPSTPNKIPGASAKLAKTQEALNRATPPKTEVSDRPPLPLQVNPPTPTTDNIHPRVTLDAQEIKPATTTTTTTTAKPRAALQDPSARRLVAKKKDTVDDDLARRFAELKR